MTMFAGALTALVTPFRDGQVDEQALRGLVDAQVDAGIDGLVPCGTTGESATLSDAEYDLVVRTVVDQAKGRVPVLAGAGSASTDHAIALGSVARAAGADGLLSVVPYYNRPTQHGMFAHFTALAEAIKLPTVLYNIPPRTGSDLALSTLERFADNETIVGIKEATGNVVRSSQVLAAFGDRFSVLSGDDCLTLPIMALGGAGVISVTANVAPTEVTRLVAAMRAGDLAGARAANRRLAPLNGALFVESNPTPAKFALAHLGRMTDEVRLPLVRPSEASQQFILDALTGLGIR
ncbi:MAG: 4-hydroxy-tetrahydrodipicolinate synthase [Myxococcales bacterium]|nr:4-hydroxy-tetrahydrodipicolinate synthase [Myxococcales bacterium]